MNRIPSIALLAGGILLVVYGVNTSNSVSSDFSRMFTGSPTDKTIWLLLVGIGAAIIGAVGLLRGPKSL